MRTYSFKLYNSKRNRHLARTVNLCGEIYNHVIALHKRHYRLFKKKPALYSMQSHIAKLKRLPKYAHWREADAQSVQNIAERIERGYEGFFKRLKARVWPNSPPKFKKVRNYKSFTLKQTGYKLGEGNTVIIQRRRYKYFKSQEVHGNIKTLTVKRDRTGSYWIFLTTDWEPEAAEPRTGKTAGLDFGLLTFLTTSEGTKIESPLPLAQSLKRLRKLSKALSRKKKGGRNRHKARLDLAKLHRHVADQRRDFHFKTALTLVRNYDALYLEDLDMKAMQKRWGRKISDLAFSEFLAKLKWMGLKYGKRVVTVDRFFPSSKTCSNCRYVAKRLSLNDRHWACPTCSQVHDRDVNAAINIKMAGASAIRTEDVRPGDRLAGFVDAGIPLL